VERGCDHHVQGKDRSGQDDQFPGHEARPNRPHSNPSQRWTSHFLCPAPGSAGSGWPCRPNSSLVPISVAVYVLGSQPSNHSASTFSACGIPLVRSRIRGEFVTAPVRRPDWLSAPKSRSVVTSCHIRGIPVTTK
jgi:hypothetical protein